MVTKVLPSDDGSRTARSRFLGFGNKSKRMEDESRQRMSFMSQQYMSSEEGICKTERIHAMSLRGEESKTQRKWWRIGRSSAGKSPNRQVYSLELQNCNVIPNHKTETSITSRWRWRGDVPNHQSSSIKTFFRENPVTIDDFRIKSIIGKGTFGKVQLSLYKRKKVNGKSFPPFAIKSMKKRVLAERNQVYHVTSERRILDEADCPFIVKLYGCFQCDRYLNFILEFVPGGELFNRIAHTGGLDLNCSLFYFCEVAAALEYLHNQGIVYRDLKPENILITQTGHIKLIDFGFAKHLSESDGFKTETLCGTAEYLAPEVIKGEPHDSRVDIWALGILLYELHVSNTPFASDDPDTIYQMAIRAHIKFPSSIPKQMKDLIRKLCHPDPEKRIGWKKESDLRTHPFVMFDWNTIKNRELVPPWVPVLSGICDVQNFNHYDDSGEEGDFLDEGSMFAQFG